MSEPTLGLFYLISDLPTALSVRIVECKSGCWEWQGARNEFGYGRPHWEGRMVYAHRLVHTLLVGLVPPDLVLDHLCRNPPCVNPAHLEPIPGPINVRRGRVVQRHLPAVVPETDGIKRMLGRPATAEWWLPVVGYEDLYEVSDRARVRSLHSYGRGLYGAILKPWVESDGRISVKLWRDGEGTTRRVHQLVAEAFLGPCPEGQEVRHLNDVKSDNRLENLEYGTSSQNKEDLIRNGRHFQKNMTHCMKGHPFDEANTRWRSDGRGRDCRACYNERGKARERALPELGKPCTTPDCSGFQIAKGLCRSCYSKARADARRGPDWANLVCPQCGSQFTRQPGWGQAVRKYCSDECREAGRLVINREAMRAKRAAKRLISN